eukprot:2087919-Lingulodinium_polyedra.AAC.1
MPRVPGAYLVHQPSHNRYYSTYLGAALGSTQCTLSYKGGEHALKVCLKWARSRHFEAIGQSCPIDGLL